MDSGDSQNHSKRQRSRVISGAWNIEKESTNEEKKI
jgi:hypothetical protein